VSTRSDPAQIGRYQVIERVGKGGMGVLFRGMDPVLDREVAIKLMLVDFSDDEEQMRPRFYVEARAAAKLQHRNIVTVFEFAEEGNTPFIVMEFLRGTSLSARMVSPLPLSLDAKLDIIAQLCDALHYAHLQGVVHRDVKPANVFLLTDGTVKLLDFGIAKMTTSTLTRQGDVLGSASYMSPEQVRGSDTVDGRADIFSVGVVLYELLTGRKPFDADQPTATIVKILNEDPTPIESLAPELPAQLVAAVNRALAKNPDDRFATAGELSKELQWIRRAVAAGEAVPLDETRFATPTEIRSFQTDLGKIERKTTTSRTAAQTAPPAPSLPKWVIPAGAAAVVLVGVLVAVSMLGRGNRPATAASPTTTGAPAAAAVPAAAPAPPASVDATLKIASEPTGAAIALDGRDTRQTTPASITVRGAGPHTLKLSKRGFVAKEINLADADVRSGSVSYTLEQAQVVMGSVSITSAYPVEVFEGAKLISRPSDSHQLKVAVGTTIRVRNPEYMLDVPVRVEAKTDYQAPPLGYLSVLTRYETCNVKIGAKDLGFPPISRLPIVAGQYKIDIVCPSGPSPNGQFVTIPPNGLGTARIQ
jgi:eukaryotic-like serine/threonine-protein kinase